MPTRLRCRWRTVSSCARPVRALWRLRVRRDVHPDAGLGAVQAALVRECRAATIKNPAVVVARAAGAAAADGGVDGRVRAVDGDVAAGEAQEGALLGVLVGDGLEAAEDDGV